MSIKVTQQGAEETPVSPTNYQDYVRQQRVAPPVTADVNEPGWDWANNLADQARAFEAAEDARIAAERGRPATGPEKYFWDPFTTGVKDIGTGVANLGRGVGWLFGADVEFQPAAGFGQGGTAEQKVGYLESLLAGTPEFNRAAYLAELDPDIQAQRAIYERYLGRVRPEIEAAQRAVSGAYGAAAGRGRTAAGNIGSRGEQLALTAEDLYNMAAQQAGDMSQAGGTMVSGLTGPGQVFQDIYGTAYGTGMGEAYGARGAADIASEDMRARAQQAAGMGTRAAGDIGRYWDRLTAREQMAFDQAQAAATTQRREGLKAKEALLDTTIGTLVGMYRTDKNERKNLKKFFPNLNDNNYSTELPRYLNDLARLHGPEAVLRVLTQSGFNFGGMGG